jgi:hypothetical protein
MKLTLQGVYPLPCVIDAVPDNHHTNSPEPTNNTERARCQQS